MNCNTPYYAPYSKILMSRVSRSAPLPIFRVAQVYSPSFTVGLLHNINAYTDHEVTKESLGAGACRIEIDLLGEPIGKQDQYAAAYGGLNIIEFHPDGSVQVEPVDISQKTRAELNANLKLYYIGNQRSASKILAEQKKNTSQEDKFKRTREDGRFSVRSQGSTCQRRS